MTEKDMTEKTLEAYNDVFADIVNVLLFNGLEIIREEDLVSDTPRSLYKAGGKLHEQERDVTKYWKNGNIRISFYGFENQTRVDKDIPLRLISYDGAAYRSLSLKECPDIPKALEPYVNDYKVHLYEIAYLTERQVRLFKSDFWIVADYFTQLRKNKNYIPSSQRIQHVDEVLKLMAAMTGDSRFEEAINDNDQKGVPRTMCEVLDRIEAKGEIKAWYRAIHNLMETTGFSVSKVMKILQVPENIQKSFLERQEEFPWNNI